MEELPINDEQLYQEMTTYLGTYYFSVKNNDDTIHELARKEFYRICKIICHKYNFDEDKYIMEGDGSSPFDFVCDDLEQEIYNRIREDPHLLQLTQIREEAIRLIRNAVKEQDNIIGTFYQNKGKHYRHDNSAKEYATSPIVVIHNFGFNTYGGYEANTLYELFINEQGCLLCTLNGESGDEFDEPIEHVLTEGLLEITHWLEEHGFINSNISANNL